MLAALFFPGRAIAAVVSVIRHRAGSVTSRLSVAYFFPFIILVPPRMVSAVAEAIPQIVTYGQASDNEDVYD